MNILNTLTTAAGVATGIVTFNKVNEVTDNKVISAGAGIGAGSFVKATTDYIIASINHARVIKEQKAEALDKLDRVEAMMKDFDTESSEYSTTEEPTEEPAQEEPDTESSEYSTTEEPTEEPAQELTSKARIAEKKAQKKSRMNSAKPSAKFAEELDKITKL